MRRRERGGAKRYELITKGGTLGPKIKGWILAERGEKLVAEEKADRVHCPKTGRLLGYQLWSSEEKAVKPKPTMDVSESVLTPQEVDAVVGEHCKGGENIHGVDGGPPGRSHTARLNPQQRELREALGMESVDFVEASRFKLNAFNPAFGRTVVRGDVSGAA